MLVHYTFSSVWVAEWPPFGKWLPARLAICSHCILSICNIFFISHFGFKSGICLLIAPVPIHCFSITFFQKTFNKSYSKTTAFERSVASKLPVGLRTSSTARILRPRFRCNPLYKKQLMFGSHSGSLTQCIIIEILKSTKTL